MKTAAEIISYLDAEREESFKQYDYWKEIDPSEAKKYMIKATTIENILDDIDPFAEQGETEEHIAKILVSNPRKNTPKKSFLGIWLNIFSFIVLASSCVAVWLFISALLERVGITGLLNRILLLGYEVLHFGSFALMLEKSHLLYILTRKQYDSN